MAWNLASRPRLIVRGRVISLVRNAGKPKLTWGTMAQNFSAQIDAWVAKTEGAAEAIFQESAQRVLAEAQKPVSMGGNLPVDTGFLRASLQVAVNNPPSLEPQGRNQSATDGEMALQIAGASIGDVIHAAWGANYAGFVEYGTSRMAPRGFVRGAVGQWQAIVTSVTQELKDRVG